MLTAVILTKDEEKNIKRCIDSLGFCDEVVIVDDESVDNTTKIARKLNVKILNNKMINYASQRNWALDQIKTGWVLFVDADEVVTKELGASIQELVQKNDANGYLVHRVDYIWNHKFRFGDVGNVWLLRLAKRGAGKWERTVHETWTIDGRVGKLKGELSHYPHQSVVEFLKHINKYSTLKAKEFYKDGKKTNIFEITLGPIWIFFKLYILKLGIFDGIAGFVHAMLMSFYMFLVAGKLYLRYNGIHGNRQAQSDQALP